MPKITLKTTQKKINVLKKMCHDGFGDMYENYSGRFMFGRKCYGIVTKNPTRCIEVAASHGVRNAVTDSMGLRFIVYWPGIPSEEKKHED